MLIMVLQIESKLGVENVDAIYAVSGVGKWLMPVSYDKTCLFVLIRNEDMLFIGPNNLALSILTYIPAKGNKCEFINTILIL